MRLKRIRVSAEVLVELLRGDFRHYTVEPPLPQDLKIVDIVRTSSPVLQNTFDLIVESEEFEELTEAGIIPDLQLVCHDVPIVKLFAVDKHEGKVKNIRIIIEGVTDH